MNLGIEDIEDIILKTSLTITNVGMDQHTLQEYMRGVAFNAARVIVRRELELESDNIA